MIVALLLAAAAPQPGALLTTADWIVGCDNARSCQAAALPPRGQGRAGYLMLLLKRDGGRDAAATLEIRFPPAIRAGALLSLAVDGKVVAKVQAPGKGAGLALPYAGALNAAFSAGRQARVFDARGRTVGVASLAGLATTLLHIDAAQQRAGTVTALRARGPRPASAVPAVPPLPVVVQPPVPAAAPATFPARDIARLIGEEAALCERPSRAAIPRSVRLDATHTLTTIDHPCGNGPDNQFTSVFVLDARGRPAPAPFDAPTAVGATVQPVVVGGGWNAATRRLTSVLRGRAGGDCGTVQSFAWDGTSFRLVEQRAMGACRGAIDYITTWRAQVAGG